MTKQTSGRLFDAFLTDERADEYVNRLSPPNLAVDYCLHFLARDSNHFAERAAKHGPEMFEESSEYATQAIEHLSAQIALMSLVVARSEMMLKLTQERQAGEPIN